MNSKYNVIYSDPPWRFAAGGDRNATNHYNCMKINDICALPVADWAADDCALFMWVTFPTLHQSFQVMDAWGFEYKTCAFAWVKSKKSLDVNQPAFFPDDNLDSFMGLGYWTRANVELCLLATKGKPKRESRSVRQVVFEPIREHSRKPDCIRERIIELCGDVPRMEMFARQTTPGWDVFGNQTDKFKGE